MKRSDAAVILATIKVHNKKTIEAADNLILMPSVAEIAATVKLRCVLERGEETEAKPTCNLLSKAVLGELFRKLGVTKKKFQKALLEIATESLVDGKFTVAEGMAQASPELLLAVREIEQTVIDKLPKQKRAGAIKVQGTFELGKTSVKFSKV